MSRILTRAKVQMLWGMSRILKRLWGMSRILKRTKARMFVILWAKSRILKRIKVQMFVILWGAFVFIYMFTKNVSLMYNRPQLSWKHQSLDFSQSLVLVACAGDSYNQTQVRNYKWAVPFDTTLNRNSSIIEILHMLSKLSNHPLSASNNNWIGVISLINPISSTLNMSLVDIMLTDKQLINDDVDVIGFLDISLPDLSFSKIMEDSCPGMDQTLRYILVTIDEDSEKVESIYLSSPVFPIFHGEFFAARPTAILSFIKWLEPVTQLLSSISTSRPGLHFLHKEDDLKNAPCKLSVLQLLASYYFNANMARIVTNKGYTKQLELHSKESDFKVYMNDFNGQSVSNISSTGIKSKPIIFILSHNEETAQKAEQISSGHSWAHPYIIPSTYYFEAYFYSHILLGIMDQETFDNAAWIGSISWKAERKANIDLIDMMVGDPDIDADVLTFFDIKKNLTLWDHADFFHPGLMDLIVYILLSVGEQMDDIEWMHLGKPAFKIFFGTYMAVRPKHIRAYIDWLTNVLKFINNDRKAQNMIWEDSGYKTPGSRDIARKIFDLGYYPMHPFVFERLVQYYFNSRGYKIMTACEYRDLKAPDLICSYVSA